MNIFQEYGIKEVANVCLYSIELDENDNEIYIPVLYMDTLKVSTVEETIQTSHAQGGIGNPKLITWDYGKDIVVNIQDALFTPASNSMNWAGKLQTKGLQLYLRHFFDRNTDNNVPDAQLRTAILTAEKFSDFLIIPDRWPEYENNRCKCSKNVEGYVGGTSIFCWLISGYITSDDCKKRVSFKDLILFYREQTQKWYFFNGKGPTEDPLTWWKDSDTDIYNIKNFPIYYQYGREVFEWIKRNIASPANKWNEYEPLANALLDYLHGDVYNIEGDNPDVFFLTQNLYIDGYRKGCAKDKLYSELMGIEEQAIKVNKYTPYRYFANIGVEYNTNITPPQDTIYKIDTALDNVFILEKMERHIANRTFCIDTDENTKHSQYRYIEKYSETPLTVFINPKTMEPYLPNSFQFYKENGERIAGNLRIITKGEKYLKWTRTKAKEHRSLGKQLIIDSSHYPGTYRLVGETYIKDRFGKNQNYQFEIPLCKLSSSNKITLQADGEPTVFDMKLTALRRLDGVMMKLTAYDVLENSYHCGVEEQKISDFITPNPELNPKPYNGPIELNGDCEIKAYEKRDIAQSLLEGYQDIGFYKTNEEQSEIPVNEKEKSKIGIYLDATAELYSIDETIREEKDFNRYLTPNEFSAKIKGSDENEHI